MANVRALAAVGAVVLAGIATAADPGAAPASLAATGDGWRSARWGMTVEEVVKAFPGEAKRLDPELKLEDGNVVAAGIDAYTVASRPFRVRFVFEKGKLAIVSLKTPEAEHAGPEAFQSLEALLTAQLGRPSASGTDDRFIDLRQTRWDVAGTQVDLKYVPGTVIIQLHPRAAEERAPGGR